MITAGENIPATVRAPPKSTPETPDLSAITLMIVINRRDMFCWVLVIYLETLPTVTCWVDKYVVGLVF